MAANRLTLENQFWKSAVKGEPNDCWLWVGATFASGYGVIRRHVDGKSKMLRTHRVSWEIHNGPIPLGMHVLHRCDRPPCCNPAHLFLGTHLDNMRDMYRKGRRESARGEQIGNAKFTRKDIIAIRASSQSRRSLAREYRVDHSTIDAICNRKTWKHI